MDYSGHNKDGVPSLLTTPHSSLLQLSMHLLQIRVCSLFCNWALLCRIVAYRACKFSFPSFRVGEHSSIPSLEQTLQYGNKYILFTAEYLELTMLRRSGRISHLHPASCPKKYLKRIPAALRCWMRCSKHTSLLPVFVCSDPRQSTALVTVERALLTRGETLSIT